MTQDNQPETPLSLEFELLRLKRFLKKNPELATEKALGIYEDFLNLSREIKFLERICESLLADNRSLQADNQRLTSELIEQSSPKTKTVELPSFLNSRRH
ncbi:hypothetical protein H1P_6560002 [Hyella patelloides LEGE 07179]|uniref:Uncharacterized protein n=1 Tax=Hyella patelloides LEGE 07179 TaxID=945734 RepID=A0A563W2I7_9CYAN|nr:hypothetical protein [Hyella patelloides]VEP17898.1 hypothetical protein H1P_6560002 [Hyella patelloides LEGE 07179]